MDWIKNLFKEQKQKDIIHWETDDSLLEYLKKNIKSDGSLSEEASTLPDEEETETGVKFAPGLMDAMFGIDE